MDNKKPHNNFFNYVFSQKPLIQDFIRELMPDIAAKINLESLEKDDTTYIDEKLKEFYSDIVYNCEQKGKHPIKITLLFEHKSTPPTYPHLQLLEYLMGVWNYNIENKEKLTPIIPIIFYHGERIWKNKSFKDYFSSLDEAFECYLPSFDYYLIDLKVYSDEKILKLKTHFLINALLALKHKNDREYVKRHYLRLFYKLEEYIDTETGARFVHHLSVYLVYATKILSREVLEVIEKLPPKIGDRVMTTYENIVQQGKEIGIVEGEEIGTLKANFQTAIDLLNKKVDKAFAAEIARLDNKTIQLLEAALLNDLKDIPTMKNLILHMDKEFEILEDKDLAVLFKKEEGEVISIRNA